MGTVIGLAGVHHDRSATSAPQAASGPASPTFTLRDRAELGAWSGVGRRAVIISCDIGAFAMLYELGRSWASWGIVRQPRGILLWNCVSHADVDRFDTVADALETIEGRIVPGSADNIVCLNARRDAWAQRRSARPVAARARSDGS